MDDTIGRTFKALSDPSRRKIFHSLIVLATAIPISQVAAQFDMSRQGVTKHLNVLQKAGLIEMQSQGRERRCQANAQPLQELNAWLAYYEKFWDQSLDNLSNYLKDKKLK